MGASAGIEVLIRRVAQIVEAYRGGAQQPQWHTVKHFTGGEDALDPVPQSLKAFNARRVREEVEADNLRFRSRGLVPPPEGGAHSSEDLGGVQASGPKAKPKFKKGGGKGLGAADG